VSQSLSSCLQRQASDILVIRKVVYHSTVPLIKADILRSGLRARGLSIPDETDIDFSSSENVNDGDIFVSLDISIDSPLHSGVATTEFVKQMINEYPTLGPAVFLLKMFFKTKVIYFLFSRFLSRIDIYFLLRLGSFGSIFRRVVQLWRFSSGVVINSKAM
jgi:hypothetical protein